jgi:hypothetical protein
MKTLSTTGAALLKVPAQGTREMRIPYQSSEISDRIVDFDSDTLVRRPVKKSDLIREFRALNNRFAVRVVNQLPADGNGILDPQAMDRLLVTVHCEMQRMSEEFQHERYFSGCWRIASS